MASFNWPPFLNAGTGANQSLSNLSNPTAINVPLLLPNGSVGAPSLSFTNDTGIGIYRSASGELSIARGGSINTAFTGNNFGGQSFLMPQNFSLIGVSPGITSTLPAFANTFTAASNSYQAGVSVYVPQSIVGGAVYNFYSSNGTVTSPLATTTSSGGNTMGYLAWHGHDGSNYQFCGGIAGLATQTWTPTARGFSIAGNVTANNTTSLVTALLLDQNADVIVPNGNLKISHAGAGIQISGAGGSNRMGIATLSGGTVTVSNPSITAQTQIFLTVYSASGTQGLLSYTQNNGVGFTINSTNAGDNSMISFLLIENI